MAVITTYPDGERLARGAAEHFLRCAGEALAGSGRFSAALSGGTTPGTLYRLLSDDPFRGQIDWSRVHLFFGDERCVAPDHPDSNYRMVREALLDRVPVPEENVFRMAGEQDPVKAAEDYERRIREFFAPGPASFDLVLLGLGEDGHTASLFPGSPALHEENRLVAAHRVEKIRTWRITLTPGIINAAASIVFLVSGARKAKILKDVLRGPRRPDALPAQAVNPAGGRLDWLLDEAASSLL